MQPYVVSRGYESFDGFISTYCSILAEFADSEAVAQLWRSVCHLSNASIGETRIRHGIEVGYAKPVALVDWRFTELKDEIKDDASAAAAAAVEALRHFDDDLPEFIIRGLLQLAEGAVSKEFAERFRKELRRLLIKVYSKN